MRRFSYSEIELDDAICPESETHRIRLLLVFTLPLLIVAPTVATLISIIWRQQRSNGSGSPVVGKCSWARTALPCTPAGRF